MPFSPADKKAALLARTDLPAGAVEAHFRRLGADYWNAFSADEIAGHITTLQALDRNAPWNVRAEDLGDGLCGLTLIGGDFQGFFAAVSGFLASDGYDIRSGRVFSFGTEAVLPVLPRGGMIDFLVIRHGDPERATEAERARVRAEMETLFRRFEKGEGAAIRVDLYRRIGARLEARALFNGGLEDSVPPEIRVHAVHDATRLTVRARDREGMLFCIAAALGLQGLSLVTLITDAGDDGFFENTLTVAGPGGRPVRDARELEKIRTGIALMERLLRTLPGAVNLQAAAEGLQRLVDDWLEETSDVFDPARDKEGRENFGVLPALSRVLTAGPRLWEAVDRIGPRAFRLLLAELAREVVPPTRAAHARALGEIAGENRGREPRAGPAGLPGSRGAQGGARSPADARARLARLLGEAFGGRRGLPGLFRRHAARGTGGAPRGTRRLCAAGAREVRRRGDRVRIRSGNPRRVRGRTGYRRARAPASGRVFRAAGPGADPLLGHPGRGNLRARPAPAPARR
jgi:hypothetical protein